MMRPLNEYATPPQLSFLWRYLHRFVDHGDIAQGLWQYMGPGRDGEHHFRMRADDVPAGRKAKYPAWEQPSGSHHCAISLNTEPEMLPDKERTK
jgi:hypothetical protein